MREEEIQNFKAKMKRQQEKIEAKMKRQEEEMKRQQEEMTRQPKEMTRQQEEMKAEMQRRNLAAEDERKIKAAYLETALRKAKVQGDDDYSSDSHSNVGRTTNFTPSASKQPQSLRSSFVHPSLTADLNLSRLRQNNPFAQLSHIEPSARDRQAFRPIPATAAAATRNHKARVRNRIPAAMNICCSVQRSDASIAVFLRTD